MLGALAPELRTVFVLFEFERLSSPEIAALLTLPLGTVASRLRRAREEFHLAATELRARRAARLWRAAWLRAHGKGQAAGPGPSALSRDRADPSFVNAIAEAPARARSVRAFRMRRALALGLDPPQPAAL